MLNDVEYIIAYMPNVIKFHKLNTVCLSDSHTTNLSKSPKWIWTVGIYFFFIISKIIKVFIIFINSPKRLNNI